MQKVQFSDLTVISFADEEYLKRPLTKKCIASWYNELPGARVVILDTLEEARKLELLHETISSGPGDRNFANATTFLRFYVLDRFKTNTLYLDADMYIHNGKRLLQAINNCISIGLPTCGESSMFYMHSYSTSGLQTFHDAGIISSMDRSLLYDDARLVRYLCPNAYNTPQSSNVFFMQNTLPRNYRISASIVHYNDQSSFNRFIFAKGIRLPNFSSSTGLCDYLDKELDHFNWAVGFIPGLALYILQCSQPELLKEFPFETLKLGRVLVTSNLPLCASMALHNSVYLYKFSGSDTKSIKFTVDTEIKTLAGLKKAISNLETSLQ